MLIVVQFASISVLQFIKTLGIEDILEDKVMEHFKDTITKTSIIPHQLFKDEGIENLFVTVVQQLCTYFQRTEVSDITFKRDESAGFPYL